jgi:hypothetical protein
VWRWNIPITENRIKLVNFPVMLARKNSVDTLKTNVLFVKMLKSTTANVRFPIWDLMMKNVYCSRYCQRGPAGVPF